MSKTVDFFGDSQFRAAAPNFWELFLNRDSVRELADFEKLLAGCEMIAALDAADCLLA